MTVLVSDSFNRANSTTALGTTDSYNGGTAKTWVADVGTWGISNNKAYEITASTTGLVWVDTGFSDFSVSADIAWQSNAGIVARYTSATDYIFARIGTTDIKLFKTVAGTSTQIGNTYTFTPSAGTTYNLKISLSGSSLTVYKDGSSVITATDTFNQTATRAGFRNFNDTTSTFDNFQAQDFNTGGTNASITSVIANATASSLASTVTTQQQVSVSGVVANANTSALAPSVSADANITSMVAISTASAINPSISTTENISISSVVASASTSALSPQVGSFTNVLINTVVANSTASSNNPSVVTTQNINLGAPIANASASALVPANVGVSTSATIAATVASLMVDVIAPTITTTQGVNVQAVSANVSANGLSPTLQRDMVLFAVMGGSQSSALAPLINWTSTAIISTTYLQGSRILNVNLQGNQVLDINLKGVV